MANITGSRADAGRLIHLAVRREREKETMERRKKEMAEEAAKLGNINEKFKAHYDAVEQTLKTTTTGLVTLDEMRAKQESVVAAREAQLARKELAAAAELSPAEREADRRRQEEAKRRVLSFQLDDEDEEEEPEPEPGPSKKLKIGKDPSVDTSFLPDKEREEEENRLREELSTQWKEEQELMKAEPIVIAFSYWDGSGHRRDLRMRKGNTISQFLQKAVETLRPDFNELKASSCDGLMFIKEDLIIPHFYSFSDFIVTKAMGKTGPLFEFNAAGELRIRADAVLDTAESHPAKVCLRTWYEKNKHIYPASQWEPFDPRKKYGRTTIDLKSL